MRMLRKALEYLADLGKVEILGVNGHTYSTKGLDLVKLPKAKPLEVNSLCGMVEYISSDFDEGAFAGTLIHVENHARVNLVSNILGDRERDIYMTAHAFIPDFLFGYFYDVESFNIKLQSCFVENGDRAKVLKIVGNIKDSVVREVGDDGISQSVVAKTGIATVEDVIVPNPVTLAPYRTFTEVEQPESKFIFRMRQGKDGPTAALFEADAGAWRLSAMQSIRDYLDEQLESVGIDIIA